MSILIAYINKMNSNTNNSHPNQNIHPDYSPYRFRTYDDRPHRSKIVSTEYYPKETRIVDYVPRIEYRILFYG